MKQLSGFTLIESLIYISLFALVMGGGLIAVYGLVEGTDRTASDNLREQEISFVGRKINWALSGARNFNVYPAGDGMSVNRWDGDSIYFDLDNADKSIRLWRNGEPSKLTSRGIVDQIYFLATSTGGIRGVSFSFSLSGQAMPTTTVYLATDL